MKTAMELALARIELMKNISPDSIHWEMFKNDCIEKEKEQIIDAYEEGKQNGMDSITNIHMYIIGEKYYNQTYNQNK